MPWASLVGGVWSAFWVGRTWNEVHWIGWFLAAAWASAAVLGLLDAQPTGRDAPRTVSVVRYLAGLLSQNASQEVLFFVLPFWIRSTTFLSANGPFTVLLVVLGASTLYDPWYLDGILPHRLPRTFFKSLLLFAGLDFLLVALTPWSTVDCVAIAGAWSGAVAGFQLARRKGRGILWGSLVGLGLLWSLRLAIAPVPLHLNHPILCSGVVHQTPIDTIQSVPVGAEIWFWTPVFAPPGRIDSVQHRWIRKGDAKATVTLPTFGGRFAGFRTWSNSRLVTSQPGAARVEVRLRNGQLLGRTSFEVVSP